MTETRAHFFVMWSVKVRMPQSHAEGGWTRDCHLNWLSSEQAGAAQLDV